MSFSDSAGGLSVPCKDAPSRPRTLSGATFDGRPFSVKLPSDIAFNHGASAAIYLGFTLGGPWPHPRIVAVKIFGQMLKPAQQEVLLRELHTASQASLRHPRILEFLGTVDVGDQKSLVSVHMQNGNLLEYLKSHRRCDRKKLIVQVAEGVDYLHTQARLVHGDLKCENVLISYLGDALLADFGLSTFVEKSQSDATTMTGIREMNTIRFAAPELLQGTDDPAIRARSKTVESDVYAFGMLILQAVTKSSPWSNLNAMAVMQKVCLGQHPPRPMTRAFVTMSHSWWDVCRNCWSPKPGDRPRMETVLGLLSHTDLERNRQLEGHGGKVGSVSYLPCGRRVVSYSHDRAIRVWDTATGQTVIGPLLGHEDRVVCVTVSPDGRQICSCGYGGTLRRWDAESGAPIGKPMTGHGHRVVTGAAFSPDGTQIVTCSGDKTVRLWDATTGEALGDPLVGHTFWVWSAAFSPDGTCIASGSYDGTLRLWDSATGASLGVLQRYGPQVFSVCFSPDRVHLISGDADGHVRIWNILTQRLTHDIYTRSQNVRSVAVSPSGGYIAAASDVDTIGIWDVQTGGRIGGLRGHTGKVSSVAFSPDGRSVVSGSFDGTVRIWDLFE